MDIARIGSQPSAKGPAEWFTGAVRIDAPFQRSSPARIAGATATSLYPSRLKRSTRQSGPRRCISRTRPSGPTTMSSREMRITRKSPTQLPARAPTPAAPHPVARLTLLAVAMLYEASKDVESWMGTNTRLADSTPE